LITELIEVKPIWLIRNCITAIRRPRRAEHPPGRKRPRDMTKMVAREGF
jgi:hypothetical protein